MDDAGGCCCCRTIPQSKVGMLEKFGRFVKVLPPGLACIMYPFECIGGTQSIRVQQLEVKTDTKTADDVMTMVVVAVQYKIMDSKLEDAYYSLADPKQQIKSYVEDVVRTCIPNMTLDQAFENKNQVALDVNHSLEDSMNKFGYNIVKTLVVDILPAKKVVAAMNEINAAKRLRMAAQEQAEAQKIKVVKAAEAEAEAKYLSGCGLSRQRQAIVDGLKESVVGFSNGVTGCTPSEVVNMCMTVQYMDMLKDVGSNPYGHTIFMSSAANGVNDVSEQVRNGFLQASAMSQSYNPDNSQKKQE